MNLALYFKLVLISSLLLGIGVMQAKAQNPDRVEVKCYSVTLYNGYVNEMNIVAHHAKDTADHYGYKLHAVANGASVNYEPDFDYPALKLFVLPNQTRGYIHFYLEKQGRFYHVSDSILFNAVKANPDDEMFQRVMGITKENPGTKLKAVKNFILPTGAKIVNSDFELDGVDFSNGALERGKYIKIRMRPMVIAVMNGQRFYVPQPSNARKLEIRSADLKIKEAGKNIFYVMPVTQKMGGRYEVYLDNKKVSDGSFTIRN